MPKKIQLNRTLTTEHTYQVIASSMRWYVIQIQKYEEIKHEKYD